MSETPTDDVQPDHDGSPVDATAPIDRHDTPESDTSVRVVDRRWWARSDAAEEDDDGTVSNKPSYVAELEKQLEEKDALLRDYAARYKKTSEEFEQTRVRLRREVTKDVERETRRVLAAFLDVVDNLDRAITAARSAEQATGLIDGVEMVRQQFLTTLEAHGVRPIDAAGAPFDPKVHDAVSTVEVEDANQVDRVVDVVKPGYSVADEVLRPATVTVGKASPAPESR